MRTTLLLLAAGAMLALCGVVHGLRTDRWGASPDLRAAAERLHAVPASVGQWQGEDLPLNARELALSGSTGALSRRYVHRVTGEPATVLLLCGRPGPVSIHTPDVCYRGLGYEPTRDPVRWSTPDPGGSGPAAFWTALFRKESPGRVEYLRLLWSWSARGTWEAADNARLAFPTEPILYKLYVLRPAADESDSLDADASGEFLREFLPALRRALFVGQ
jgi:hypothetical protein